MARPKLKEPRKEIVRLYQKGYTQKEIASALGISKTTVNEHIKLIPERHDYFRQLVTDCVIDITKGEICYCFTKEQLDTIRERFENYNYSTDIQDFEVQRTDHYYILIPMKEQVK